MRIGVFGGTFDPIHYGHLIIAEQAREQAKLDRVWFLPSARPPHKSDRVLTPYDRRVEMLTLAIAGLEDRFAVSQIERDRPGPSYTADTLDQLDEQFAGNEWFLIVGADSLLDLPSWYDPKRILERATLLAAGRPGYSTRTTTELADALEMRVDKVRLQTVQIPLIEIASRDLRRRASEHRSLTFMMPRALEVYIREKKLYQA